MQILTKGVRDELLSEILNPSDLVAFVEALQTAKSLMTQNLHQHISFDFPPPPACTKRGHTHGCFILGLVVCLFVGLKLFWASDQQAN